MSSLGGKTLKKIQQEQLNQLTSLALDWVPEAHPLEFWSSGFGTQTQHDEMFSHNVISLKNVKMLL